MPAAGNTMIPVVLSGGAGTRLWPLSREMYPKQLLPLTSDRTMLQDTAITPSNRRKTSRSRTPYTSTERLACVQLWQVATTGRRFSRVAAYA